MQTPTFTFTKESVESIYARSIILTGAVSTLIYVNRTAVLVV